MLKHLHLNRTHGESFSPQCFCFMFQTVFLQYPKCFILKRIIPICRVGTNYSPRFVKSLFLQYGLATVTGCRLSYFSNERSTKFPPNLDDFKSVMVSNHYQRIVRSQVQFRLIREAYIKHQVENHLCKIGYPAPLFPKILEN